MIAHPDSEKIFLNIQNHSLISRNKSRSPLKFYVSVFVMRSQSERVPSLDTSQPTWQISACTAHPPNLIKESALKVIWKDNVPIFFLAFQNPANFLSLLQSTKFPGKVTVTALKEFTNSPRMPALQLSSASIRNQSRYNFEFFLLFSTLMRYHNIQYF